MQTHSGVSPSLSTLFQNTAQNDLVAIYLAVLFGKNVVVFGSKEISSDVLCRISSGISSLISSSIKSALCRNYPYASLHDSSALQTKGYGKKRENVFREIVDLCFFFLHLSQNCSSYYEPYDVKHGWRY